LAAEEEGKTSDWARAGSQGHSRLGWGGRPRSQQAVLENRQNFPKFLKENIFYLLYKILFVIQTEVFFYLVFFKLNFFFKFKFLNGLIFNLVFGPLRLKKSLSSFVFVWLFDVLLGFGEKGDVSGECLSVYLPV
jgi:hypothetical protein